MTRQVLFNSNRGQVDLLLNYTNVSYHLAFKFTYKLMQLKLGSAATNNIKSNSFLHFLLFIHSNHLNYFQPRLRVQLEPNKPRFSC